MFRVMEEAGTRSQRTIPGTSDIRSFVAYLAVFNILLIPLVLLILQSQEVEVTTSMWSIGFLFVFGAGAQALASR